MATAPVNLPPSLRPWQRAGVEFLLAEQPLPAPWSLCIAAPPPSPASPARVARPQSSPRPAPPPVNSVRPAPSAAVRQPQRPAASVAPGPDREIPAGTSESASLGQTASPILAPEFWPALWQERLRKTAPAVVLWTYWALGEDLCLRPDPDRRALLQRLLGDLGHPAGTHSFWPAALPAPSTDQPEAAAAAGELQANPEVFWAGVQTLKARALVVMGSAALKALNLPPRLRPFQQTRHQGRLIVVLRDVDFLAKESHRYDAVREFLKQALAPFGRG